MIPNAEIAQFVHRANISRYRKILATHLTESERQCFKSSLERTLDDAERQRILKLLAEEEARAAVDPAPPKQAKVKPPQLAAFFIVRELQLERAVDQHASPQAHSSLDLDPAFRRPGSIRRGDPFRERGAW